MRRSSLPKPVRNGLAVGAFILVIVALVGFAGAPRTLAVSAPTPEELSLWVNVYVRLWPPGAVDELPPKADIRNDWPGHLVATATVPKNGLGSVEVGLHAIDCLPDGTCPLADISMAMGGVGPPPGVPRDKLITGFVSGIVDPVAGVPFDLAVDIEQKADWDPTSLGLPDRLIAIAHHPRGPDLATGELLRQGAAGQPYAGTLTIPDAGDIVVVAALPGSGSEEVVIPTTTTRLTVATTGRELPAAGGEPTGGDRASGAPRAGTNPTPVDAGGSDDLSLLLWIVGVGVVLLITALMVRPVFADL